MAAICGLGRTAEARAQLAHSRQIRFTVVCHDKHAGRARAISAGGPSDAN